MAEPFYEALTPLDAWFLYLERPDAPLHIGGVYIFDGKPEVKGAPGAQGIAKTLESRLHLVPRYRQKVRWLPLNVGHPVWVDDPDFDMSYHVRRAALPRPGGMAELRDYAARVLARPLDLAKPLWEITVVEGLAKGRVAVINKVHHAMVDGISSVDIGTLLFDMDPHGAVKPMNPPRWEPRPAPTTQELLIEEVRSAVDPLRAIREIGSGGVHGVARGLVDGLLHSPWVGAAQLALASLRPGPRLPFNAMIGPGRRVQHVSVPLADIKLVKDAFGGTINDVVLAVVADAMRRYLGGRGDAVPDHVRVFCPVSVRDESARYALGNQVSGIFVDLPLGSMPPLTRLGEVSNRTGDLKRSRQAVAAQTLSALTDWAPATLHALGARAVAGQPAWQPQQIFNFVVTNVPGPQQPFYTGGARMIDVWPFVPIYHQLGLGFALFSYDGSINFGLMADRDLVPDLDDLAGHVEDAIESYRSLARRLTPASRARRARRATSNGAVRAAGARRSSTPRG